MANAKVLGQDIHLGRDGTDSQSVLSQDFSEVANGALGLKGNS
jgi:hypothetical protein